MPCRGRGWRTRCPSWQTWTTCSSCKGPANRGLTFTAATHKLGGMPSAPKAKVSYTYTATETTDPDGTNEPTSKTFTIGIQPQKPANSRGRAANGQVELSWTAIAGVTG